MAARAHCRSSSSSTTRPLPIVPDTPLSRVDSAGLLPRSPAIFLLRGFLNSNIAAQCLELDDGPAAIYGCHDDILDADRDAVAFFVANDRWFARLHIEVEIRIDLTLCAVDTQLDARLGRQTQCDVTADRGQSGGFARVDRRKPNVDRTAHAFGDDCPVDIGRSDRSVHILELQRTADIAHDDLAILHGR